MKEHVTTGFSRINNSYIILPLFIKQLDLKEQKHINALVLEYLLQPKNQVALMLAPRIEGEQDTERLLSIMVNIEKEV